MQGCMSSVVKLSHEAFLALQKVFGSARESAIPLPDQGLGRLSRCVLKSSACNFERLEGFGQKGSTYLRQRSAICIRLPQNIDIATRQIPTVYFIMELF
jgi:hypothetical protein